MSYLNKTKTAGMPEPCLIGWKIRAMRNPPPVVKHARSNKVTIDVARVLMGDVVAFMDKFRREVLVGVEVEHPLISEVDGFQGEVTLISKIGESPDGHARTGGLCYCDGSVG